MLIWLAVVRAYGCPAPVYSPSCPVYLLVWLSCLSARAALRLSSRRISTPVWLFSCHAYLVLLLLPVPRCLALSRVFSWTTVLCVYMRVRVYGSHACLPVWLSCVPANNCRTCPPIVHHACPVLPLLLCTPTWVSARIANVHAYLSGCHAR